MIAEAAFKCDYPEHQFVAISNAGLANHTRQKHQQAHLAQSANCQRTFHSQDLANHQCFCTERSGN